MECRLSADGMASGFQRQSKRPVGRAAVAYLLDPATLDKYTYATNTIGGTRALSELADKIAWAQKYRGPGVRPLQLSSIWMPTIQRAHAAAFHRAAGVDLPDEVRRARPQALAPDQWSAGAAAAIPATPTAADKLDAFSGQSDAPAASPAAKPATPAGKRSEFRWRSDAGRDLF
jgi:hypothetical protein